MITSHTVYPVYASFHISDGILLHFFRPRSSFVSDMYTCILTTYCFIVTVKCINKLQVILQSCIRLSLYGLYDTGSFLYCYTLKCPCLSLNLHQPKWTKLNLNAPELIWTKPNKLHRCESTEILNPTLPHSTSVKHHTHQLSKSVYSSHDQIIYFNM